jgi:hypothetical protein
LIGTEDASKKTGPTAAYPPAMNNMIACLLFNEWVQRQPGPSEIKNGNAGLVPPDLRFWRQTLPGRTVLSW